MRKTKQNPVRFNSPATMEAMEGRRLMSAAAAGAEEVINAHVSHTGVMRINGTSEDDGVFVTISRNGKRVNVLSFDPEISYEPLRVYTAVNSFSIGAVKKLSCNVGDGDDNVTVVVNFRKRCTLLGSEGSDDLYGGGGNDIIHGGPGSDHCDGGRGNDKCYGDDGADGVFGGFGRDTLEGGADPDTVIGGPDDDLLLTRDGDANEYVNGNGGVDKLIGDRSLKTGRIETNWFPADIGTDIEVLDLADAPE